MTPLRGIRSFVLAAIVVTALGCARTDWIDRTLVTESVTGAWAGTMISPDGPSVGQTIRLELQQEGPRVTGYVRGGFVGSISSPRGSTSIEGNVAGDVFRFKDERGTLTGELTISGDEMRGSGTIGNSRPVTFNLRRVDASSSPSAPKQ
jgi:hypothetical protein